MNRTTTQRGFTLIQFKDRYGVPCSIQKSSLATEDCIWMGVESADPKILMSKVRAGGAGWVTYPLPPDVALTTRMHLTVDQAKDIVHVLNEFIATGNI